MNYQKFYTNGIHSSSLLCQLATMWKSQTLCDAIIKTGNINTKAHRLVLVAACPMLQSMDNASIGSHLEVRLASEIKQDSVNMFLQYLYEGFMMLTEDNHKDIEKIARLLQVDSVIKCCADFCKSLHEKTGLSVYSAGQYKYSSHDMLEFKHVRVSGIQKTVQDTMMKRHSDFQRPNSPGSKRPRMHRPGSPSDGPRGDNMYGHSSHSDSDRVPRLGLGSFPGAAGRNLQPGVVEVIEDSLELVQTEPVERDPVTGRPIDSRPPVQKTVAISVASQVTGGDPDLQIVNVSGMKDSTLSRTQMSTATHTTSTPIARDSRGPSSHSSFSSQQSSQSMRNDIPMPSSSRVSSDRTMPQMPRSDIQRSMQNQFELQQQQQKQSTSQYPSIPQALIDMDFSAAKQKSSDVFPTSLQKATDSFPTSLPKPSDVTFPGMSMSSQPNSTQVAQSKPFAAGSAGQANQSVPVHINTSSSSSSPITSLPPVSPIIPDTSFSLSASSPKTSQPSTSRSESLERPGSSERLKEERPPQVDLVGPDISIVKIESTDKDETGALDMYVDTGDDGEVHPHGMEGDGDQTYEGSDYDVEEPPGEMEGSNEGSNLSGDQNAWYLNTMKGDEDFTFILPNQELVPTPGSIQRPVQKYVPATQKRTERDIKFIKAWFRSNGIPDNIEYMSDREINDALMRFYSEVRTRDNKQFTRHTLANYRASLNRYLVSLPERRAGWQNLLRNCAFASSNDLLDQRNVEERQREKLLKSIPLSTDDRAKLTSSNITAMTNPVALQRKVWIDLVLHFGLKGNHAMWLLSRDSFVLRTDSRGLRYFMLDYDAEIGKASTYTQMRDWHWSSRMYEVPQSPYCPVTSMTWYLSKLCDNENNLFQRPLETGLWSVLPTWYQRPLGLQAITRMMSDISKDGDLSCVYTNTSVRSTVNELLLQCSLTFDAMFPNLSHAGPKFSFSDDEQKASSHTIHKLFYSACYCDVQSDTGGVSHM
ncbi:uncharacterized protein LOC117336489 isoform X2 [Pecten maximus]|uniref:uncharacterized protein LOC117336489 isoform X2 n=1 Tax=Pecten maximus TaxID=6579 RepID=UPI0014590C86|nr:uncharacterized protein LOC117336489 isoform X2 [Pecten maximus]